MNPLDRESGDHVFDEPWQAQAFALTCALHEQGQFTWTEWAHALAREVALLGADNGGRYYEAWLAALESVAAQKGLTDPAALEQRKHEWDRAFRRTPHGRSVELALGA